MKDDVFGSMKKGDTLVVVAIVVSVLALLVSLYSLKGKPNMVVKEDIETIQKSMEQYASDIDNLKKASDLRTKYEIEKLKFFLTEMKDRVNPDLKRQIEELETELNKENKEAIAPETQTETQPSGTGQ